MTHDMDKAFKADHKLTTYSGMLINCKNPAQEEIKLVDIAVGLSRACRFMGQGKYFYSVATHSIEVFRILYNTGYDARTCLTGLMHDASEAYIGDLAAPIKKFIPEYNEYEKSLMRAISIKFNFDYPFSPPIKEADQQAFEEEWEFLITRKKKLNFFPTPSEEATRFIAAYNYLKEKIRENE